MRTACSLGSLLSIQQVLDCTRTLSKTDVDAIWIPETWGMELFSMLGAVSNVAPTVPCIGSSIVNVYSRSPAVVAMGAATVDALSRGRLILGMGTSSPPIVQGLHGGKFTKPLSRTREYIKIIRLILAGDPIDYTGDIFCLKGFQLLIRPVRDSIPIYLAAVNSQMVQLAWDVCDGVIFYMRPRDEMKKTIKKMHDNTKTKIDVTCQLVTCVATDSQKAITRAKKTIGFYVAVGKIYREFLASVGFAKHTQEIYQEYTKSGLYSIERFVPDCMVDALAVCGTPEEAIGQLDRFRDAKIDLPILQFNPVGDDIQESFNLFTKTFFRGTNDNKGY